MNDFLEEAFQLNEMAMSRIDAIDRCYSLGKPFIEHFHKIYLDTENPARNHWESEMQNWYNMVRDITLKPKNKHLNMSQMKDWFYSFGSSYEEFFNEDSDEIEAYESFIDELDESGDVKKSIGEVLKTMNKVVLYSTGCPKCKILEQKLNMKNIPYEKTDDVSELIELGFMSAPVLKVDDKYLEFKAANEWINRYGE